jgi:hypothetical protein
MLPVVLGGMALFGAGFVAKKIYDENQVEIEGKIEEGLEAIAEWFDTKTEAINNYAFSKSEKPYQVEEEINLESLQQMKKRVYEDAFKKFVTLYEKIENVDFGKLELKEVEFNKTYGEEIYDKTIQNNIQITTELLSKANNVLSEMNINLDEIIQEEQDFNHFRAKEKELLKESFSLAKFVQKVCEDDLITENMVEKFNEIILSMQKNES